MLLKHHEVGKLYIAEQANMLTFMVVIGESFSMPPECSFWLAKALQSLFLIAPLGYVHEVLAGQKLTELESVVTEFGDDTRVVPIYLY